MEKFRNESFIAVNCPVLSSMMTPSAGLLRINQDVNRSFVQWTSSPLYPPCAHVNQLIMLISQQPAWLLDQQLIYCGAYLQASLLQKSPKHKSRGCWEFLDNRRTCEVLLLRKKKGEGKYSQFYKETKAIA